MPSSAFFSSQAITPTRTATGLTNSVFGAHDGGVVYQYDAALTTLYLVGRRA